MAHERVLTNARIVDGTGASWFRGHVHIESGRISELSRGTPPTDDGDVVNVDDAIVCPGFIDLHSHSGLRLFEEPSLAPKTRQGVTTEIVGQDGFSMAPMYREGGAEEWADHLAGLDGRTTHQWTWGSVAEYLDAVDDAGVASNVGTLVGHGTVRYDVLGMSNDDPSPGELDEMAALVTEALDDGALGFSTGLVYPPHVNAGTEEVQTLAARLAPYGRPFFAHIRSERRWLWEAMDEFIDIGAAEGIPLHHSHFKVGKPQRGKADRALEFVEAARERGVDYTADAHPYTAGSTMLSGLLPPWVHAEGTEQALAYLQDSEARERITKDIREFRIDGWDNQGQVAGWDNVIVTGVDSTENEACEGKSITEIAATRSTTPIETVCDLVVEEEFGVNILMFYLDETDVEQICSHERVAISTDALFGGTPHPRTFGTYPRILGEFVRTKNLLSIEEAVRKMTSLPARAAGLTSKGTLREGMDADLVVLDPMVVDSPATYETPRKYPRGIDHVLVNGEFVVRDGEVTGETPGSAIRATS